MSLVLLRDDDANATTDPGFLAATYSPLFDAGLPVCFSVIPEVALDTQDAKGDREAFLDLGTAPVAVGRTRLLTGDTALAAWLREHEGRTDVLVHGLTHERLRGGTELGALSASEARPRLAEGRAVLARALGRTPVGFVAPWDALSRGALIEATAAFDLVSTGFVDRGRLPPSAWGAHVVERFTRRGALRVGRGWVLRHGGCRITRGTPPEDVPAIVRALCRHSRIAVIVLHHWHFAGDPGPPAPIVALARSLRGHRVLTVRDAVRCLDGGTLGRTDQLGFSRTA